ncbi:MAG: T9SS type A sorting domain-containing protein, partial [Flavobacterium sp.]|uniref:T9SS type A sorting domain-containing protein n=1 Tax=Flavobacterium sp. TaxID=239 RepID=UPI003BD35578
TAKILPYASGFDNATTDFVGWTTYGNSAYGPGTNSSFAQAGTQYWIFNDTVGSVSNNWLFSPAISLQANEKVIVSFWERNGTTAGNRNLRLTVGNAASPDAQTTVIYSNAALLNNSYTQITAPEYQFLSAGIYYFAFNDISNAANSVISAAMRIDTVNFATNLSTGDFLSSKFAIYPNPANDILNFSNQDNAIVSSVEMLDLNGRIVKSVKVNATEGQFSISDLATGIYMMKISTDIGIATKKIIKE